MNGKGKIHTLSASGKAADFQTLEAIESVPRSERGELFRNAFISGMALHQLDPRLPVLLTAILSEEFSADQVVTLLSQTTGWKPSQADIRTVLTELGASQSVEKCLLLLLIRCRRQ